MPQKSFFQKKRPHIPHVHVPHVKTGETADPDTGFVRWGKDLSILALLSFFMIQISALWLPASVTAYGFMPICTLQGVAYVPASTATNSDGENQQAPQDQQNRKEREDQKKSAQCPLCMVRSASLMTPQMPLLFRLNQEQKTKISLTHDSSPLQTTDTLPTRPRAPPVFS